MLLVHMPVTHLSPHHLVTTYSLVPAYAGELQGKLNLAAALFVNFLLFFVVCPSCLENPRLFDAVLYCMMIGHLAIVEHFLEVIATAEQTCQDISVLL